MMQAHVGSPGGWGPLLSRLLQHYGRKAANGLPAGVLPELADPELTPEMAAFLGASVPPGIGLGVGPPIPKRKPRR
jgi:hypothetical protein